MDDKKEQTTEKPIIDKDDMMNRFAAFDKAIRDEVQSNPPVDVQESRDRLTDLINLLPQRPAIHDKHATSWLLRTFKTAEERMILEQGEENVTLANIHNHVLWHVRRASGIGGSEIGTIVKHFRGKRGGFSDARTLVMQKLLILSPMPGDEAMSRGVRAEPWIQKMYHEATKSKTNEKALEKLRDFRWDRCPSSIGTPDDIVDLPGNRTRMADYKAPSADVVAEYIRTGISFDYVCQVHHYGVLSIAAGVKIHEMTLEALDPYSFTIKQFPVPFDKNLAREINTSSTKIWNDFVMQGIAPEKIEPDELDLTDPDIVDKGYQRTALKIMEDEMKARGADIMAQISAASDNWHNLSEGRMDLDIASFDRTRSWNEDKIVEIAESAGIDLSEYRTPGTGYKKALVDKMCVAMRKCIATEKRNDKEMAAVLKKFPEGEEGREEALMEVNSAIADNNALLMELAKQYAVKDAMSDSKLDVPALVERLENDGINIMQAAEISESFRLCRKSKGPEVERLNALRASLSDMSESVEVTLAETVPEIRRIATEAGALQAHADEDMMLYEAEQRAAEAEAEAGMEP